MKTPQATEMVNDTMYHEHSLARLCSANTIPNKTLMPCCNIPDTTCLEQSKNQTSQGRRGCSRQRLSSSAARQARARPACSSLPCRLLRSTHC